MSEHCSDEKQQQTSDSINGDNGVCSLSSSEDNLSSGSGISISQGNETGNAKSSSEEDQHYDKLLEQMKCSKCSNLMELPIYENSDYQRICSECYEKLPIVPQGFPHCCKCEGKVQESYFTESGSTYCIVCYKKFCKVGCIKRSLLSKLCKNCNKQFYYTAQEDVLFIYCKTCSVHELKFQSLPVCAACGEIVCLTHFTYEGKAYCEQCYIVTGFGGEMHEIKRTDYEQKEDFAHCLYLQSLVDLVFYPCSHTGCDAKLKLAHKMEHESSCKHRKLKCCFCKWEGELGAYREHTEVTHAFSFISSSLSDSNGVLFATKQIKDGQHHNYLQIFDGKMFKISCSLIDSAYWFWIQCYGSKEEAAKYNFIYFLQSGNLKIQNTSPVLGDLETKPAESCQLPDKQWMCKVGLLSDKGTVIKFKITKLTLSGASSDFQAPKLELLNVE